MEGQTKDLVLQPAPARRRRPRGRRNSRATREIPVTSSAKAHYRPLACSTILNENKNRELPFHWTINPYRGCQFGCSFCYARYTHEYLDHPDPEDFSSVVYVKFQAAPVLRETISPAMILGRPITIGTATDPYQPAEKRFHITRRILEVLSRCPGIELSITTRSPLITRDIELLRKIARIGTLTVQVSLITTNPNLARILERGAPTPRRRLSTIRALSSAGIRTGVFVMPILPGITDSPSEMRAVLRASHKAGATFAVGGMVHLHGISWRAFEPTLRQHFPHLVERYRAMRQRGGRFSADQKESILETFRGLQTEAGLSSGPGTDPSAQNSGFGGNGWLFEEPEHAVSNQLTQC